MSRWRARLLTESDRPNSRLEDTRKNALKTTVAADGRALGGRGSGRQWLAIRAEMGRVSLHRLSRRSEDLFAIKTWPAPRALFSRHRRGTRWVTGTTVYHRWRIGYSDSQRFSFNELQLRLHPAASRVQKLAKAHPAMFIIVDLCPADRKSYVERSLKERRDMLEEFARENFETKSAL